MEENKYITGIDKSCKSIMESLKEINKHKSLLKEVDKSRMAHSKEVEVRPSGGEFQRPLTYNYCYIETDADTLFVMVGLGRILGAFPKNDYYAIVK